MDGVTLIHRARDAGLRLEVAGNTVKITGPKEAEPLVKLLAEHKAQVLEALTNSGRRELRELRKISPENQQGNFPQSVEEEARRDRFEERAAILESDDGLPRAEAAHRKMAGVYDDVQAECDPGSYASALAVLRAERPAYVPEDRWRQAVTDAMAFSSEWGEQAQTLGWMEHELFGLHPVPEQPAANYSRLSRLDETGLIWLLRGRPVITLTATEAVMRCHSGATLTYRRNEPAAEIAKRTTP
jgi:hypothetical protein